MSELVGVTCKTPAGKKFIRLPLQRYQGVAVTYEVAGEHTCRDCTVAHPYTNSDAVDELGNSLAEV